MSPIQHEARLSEKSLQQLAKQSISIPELVKMVDNDPPKPGHRRRIYTIENPPPHLRAIPRSLLEKAYNWAEDDWYLIEPLSNGVRVHNNRTMADRYRKSH